MEARVLKGEAAGERLAALGAKEEWFRDAVKASELARDACSPLHAPTFPGFNVLVAWILFNLPKLIGDACVLIQGRW